LKATRAFKLYDFFGPKLVPLLFGNPCGNPNSKLFYINDLGRK
jgi:hypothetical protein